MRSVSPFKATPLLASMLIAVAISSEAKSEAPDVPEAGFEKELSRFCPRVASIALKEGKIVFLDDAVESFNQNGIFQHVSADKILVSLKANRVRTNTEAKQRIAFFKKVFELFESVARTRALLAFDDNEKSYLLVRAPDEGLRTISLSGVSQSVSAAGLQRAFGGALGYNGVVLAQNGDAFVVAGERRFVNKSSHALTRDESVGKVVPEIRGVQPRALLACEPFGNGILAKCRKIVGDVPAPGTAVWFSEERTNTQ